jgi:hypothetical protein
VVVALVEDVEPDVVDVVTPFGPVVVVVDSVDGARVVLVVEEVVEGRVVVVVGCVTAGT